MVGERSSARPCRRRACRGCRSNVGEARDPASAPLVAFGGALARRPELRRARDLAARVDLTLAVGGCFVIALRKRAAAVAPHHSALVPVAERIGADRSATVGLEARILEQARCTDCRHAGDAQLALVETGNLAADGTDITGAIDRWWAIGARRDTSRIAVRQIWVTSAGSATTGEHRNRNKHEPSHRRAITWVRRRHNHEMLLKITDSPAVPLR